MPLTSWRIVCALLADPAPASRELAERLERWPAAVRRAHCGQQERPERIHQPAAERSPLGALSGEPQR